MNIHVNSNASRKSDHIQREVVNFRDHNDLAHATFHLISHVKSQLNSPFVKTTYPADWIGYYLLNDFLKVDPVVRMAGSTEKPFHWSDINMSRDERDMMATASDHGLSTLGFTVPTFDVGPYQGLFTIVPHLNTSTSTWYNFVEQRASMIHDFAFSLHKNARLEIDPSRSYITNLTPREIECLKYISSGKTHTEIAGILKLSEHTIRSYLRTLRLKLNCSTLAQAVAKASAQNII